ncbi:MAG: hypothetical protein ACE5IT_02470 [bacterium]
MPILSKNLNRIKMYGVVLLLLIFGLPSLSLAKMTHKFWADLSGGAVYDDNVYKDSTGYMDIGYGLNLALGLRSKFSRYTFSRLRYRFRLKNFSEYDLENQNSHQFDGLLKQRLGEFFTLDLNGRMKFSQLVNASTYNSQMFLGRPNLKWYVFDHTTLTTGYIYEKNAYPDYDLDYEESGFLVKLGQELSLYTYLEFSGSSQIKDYSERSLYGIDGKVDYTITGGSRTLTDEMRKDEIVFFETRLSQDITDRVKMELGYQYRELDSNGNYFDWGPKQWEEENTTPNDERLVRNYYSYRNNRFGLKIRIILDGDSYLGISGHYQNKDYRGRLAKDKNDEFLSPEEKRKDKQIFISASWVKEISKEILRDFPIENLEIKIGYSYENNQSNDALYDYSNSIILISLSSWF